MWTLVGFGDAKAMSITVVFSSRSTLRCCSSSASTSAFMPNDDGTAGLEHVFARLRERFLLLLFENFPRCDRTLSRFLAL